ncbi:nose resistant to fluoxetine protein 6-like isoform X2 [Glandiceps talaboti]
MKVVLVCMVMVIHVLSVVEAQNIMGNVFTVLGAWPDRQAPGNPLVFYSTGVVEADYDLTWNLKDVGDFTMCRQSVGQGFSGQYCYVGTQVDQVNRLYLGTCFPDSCTNEDVGIFVLEGFKNLSANPYYATFPDCIPESYAYRAQDIVAIILCVILLIIIIIGTSYDVARSIRAEKKSKKVESHQILPEQGDQQTNNATVEGSENVHTVEVLLNEPQSARYGALDGVNELEQNPEQNVSTIHCEPRKEKNSYTDKLGKCLLAFSFIDIGGRMLKASHGKGSITCLNGIRVLSMFWIILFHTYLFAATSTAQISNVRYVEEQVKTRWAAMPVNKGDLGVEAFLVMSGLLVCYLTLKQFDKCGGPSKLNWVLFYFHRFWRLTPVYMFTIMIYSTLTLHMGDGIWWNNWFGAQYICEARWWANLLYIHNLFPFPGDASQCMGWTWYLSLDMQLYWLSPIFIIAFYSDWRIGVGLSLIVSSLSLGLSGFFATVQGMTVYGGMGYRKPMFTPGSWLYTKPYYRISEYLVGIALGYVLHRLNGKKVKIHKILNIVLWSVAAGVAMGVVYGPYGTSIDNTSATVAAFYLTIHRFAFSLCIGWVIFACATGNGGPVDTLLSWTAWLPLARLNYSAYLVHLTVIFIYAWGLNDLIYYTHFNFSILYIGMVVISYIVAFVVATAVEMPMIGLEKVLIPGKNKKSE